uniref:Uncharacterized protein n=1 Tax=Octopus bimaculoides TaxID=37653 RepID=A0A0L8IEW3_OCTBM
MACHIICISYSNTQPPYIKPTNLYCQTNINLTINVPKIFHAFSVAPVLPMSSCFSLTLTYTAYSTYLQTSHLPSIFLLHMIFLFL